MKLSKRNYSKQKELLHFTLQIQMEMILMYFQKKTEKRILEYSMDYVNNQKKMLKNHIIVFLILYHQKEKIILDNLQLVSLDLKKFLKNMKKKWMILNQFLLKHWLIVWQKHLQKFYM